MYEHFCIKMYEAYSISWLKLFFLMQLALIAWIILYLIKTACFVF